MANDGNIDLQNGVFASAATKPVTIGTIDDQPVRFFCNNEDTRAVCELRVKTAVADMASGAATLEAFIPAGALILGISSVVETALVGSGVTGYAVGISGDANLFGEATGLTRGTAASGNRTAATNYNFAAATDLVVDDVGGTSTAGEIRVSCYYITLPAPTT